MALPRWLANVNRRMLNPLMRPAAGWLPWFGVVTHVGRISRRVYRTPVNLFPAPGGYVVAVSYGRASDWARNVLTAGGCSLQTRGRRVPISRATLVRDRHRRLVPAPARLVMRLFGVDEFIVLTPGDAPGQAPPEGSVQCSR